MSSRRVVHAEYPPWLAPVLIWVAMVVIVLLSGLFGCGGGGGTPPPSDETRSVNMVTTTFGSKFFHDQEAVFNWVGDRTGTLYGSVKILTVTKKSGASNVRALANGHVMVDNTVARDTVVFDITTVHPDGTGDPQHGQALSGTATFDIKPQDARVDPTVANPFTIAADRTLTMAVQAQDSRAPSSKTVMRLFEPPTISRQYVNTDASWSVSPTNAGSIAKNVDGTAVFTAAPGFVGNVTIMVGIADAFGGAFNKTITGSIIAHPTIAISSPTEGQAISGQFAVSYTTTGASSVTYQIDAGAQTTVVGGGFNLDTTALINGAHTITMRATGQLETASVTRNVTVNNTTGGDKQGEVFFSGTKYNTNTDRPDPLNLQNTAVYIFKDGKGACAITPNSILRLFDASGQVVRSDWLQVAIVYTFAVTPQDQIVIPCPNEGQIRVYDPHSGGIVQQLSLGSFNTARYSPSLGRIIIAGDSGIGFLNPSNWSFTPFKSGLNESYLNACTNGTVVVGWHKSDGHWLKFDMNGILQKDFQVLPINAYDTIIPQGRDMLVATDRTTKSIFRMVLSTGSVIGYNPLPLPGGEQVQGIGQDLSDPLGATLLFAPNAAPYAYFASVGDRP